MQIKFHVTGSDRKALVLAVREILNHPQKYLGAPTFAYEVGSYTIDKAGTLSGSVSEAADSELCKQLADKGFTSEADQQNDTEGLDCLSIELLRDGFTDTAITNLEKLVESKAVLIKKAIGADSLPIEWTNETICFLWLQPDTPAEVIKAVTQLIVALCDMAKEQKRITATAKEVENEKYAFRCFLLRLGFIGDEYKAARKILLSKLDGNTAFKSERCES